MTNKDINDIAVMLRGIYLMQLAQKKDVKIKCRRANYREIMFTGKKTDVDDIINHVVGSVRIEKISDTVAKFLL